MKVRVTAKPEKFRRAGLEFTREPREIEVDAKVFETLKKEPMLVVESIKDGKAEDGNTGNKSK